MGPAGRRLLAPLCSLGLLLLLLLVLALGNQQEGGQPALTMREVALAAPPPPPPPPPPRNPREADESPSRPDLGADSLNSALQLVPGDSPIEVAAAALGDAAWGAGDGLTGLRPPLMALQDLDALPMPVQDPGLVYPEDLARAGVKVFQVRLHIEVEPDGRARLVRVLESNHPEYNAKLADYVAKVRFTPPTVSGIPVQSEFSWPVVFECPDFLC